jgi:hypothetical protein
VTQVICSDCVTEEHLPADGPLVIENGPDTFTFPAPSTLPVVTHHREMYLAEEVFEDQVTEYRMRCGACGVQIISHEPHLARGPWWGAAIVPEEKGRRSLPGLTLRHMLVIINGMCLIMRPEVAYVC